MNWPTWRKLFEEICCVISKQVTASLVRKCMMWSEEKKEKIRLNPITKALTPPKNSKKQNINKKATQISITQRLRTTSDGQLE